VKTPCIKSIFLCLAAVLVFSACGSYQSANNSTQLIEEREGFLPQSVLDENSRIRSKSWDFLYDSMPELFDWADYIDRKSAGKAHMTSMAFTELRDIYNNGEEAEYLGKYYSIYVGEQWEDHRVNWAWFHVNESFTEILWENLAGIYFLTLDEWRESPQYLAISSMVDDGFTMNKVTISDLLPVLIFRINRVDEQKVPDEVLEAEGDYSDQFYQVFIAYYEQPSVVTDEFYFGTQEKISKSRFSFVDIDSDGIKDIEIVAGMGNVNSLLKYYRWDNIQKRYNEKPFFVMNAADYQIFPDTKQIIAETRSTAFTYQRVLYQLIDENYVQLRIEESEAIEAASNGRQWKVIIRDEQGELYSEILTEEEYENTSLRDSILRYCGIEESINIAKVRLLLYKAYGETIVYDNGGLVYEYPVSIVFDRIATLNGETCYSYQVFYLMDDTHWVLIKDIYAASDGTIVYSDNHDFDFADEE